MSQRILRSTLIVILFLSALIRPEEAQANGFKCEVNIVVDFDDRKVFTSPLPRSITGVTHMFLKSNVSGYYDFCQMSETTGEVLKIIKNVPDGNVLWSKFEYMQDTNYIIGPDRNFNIRIYNTNSGESEILSLPGIFVKYLADDNTVIYRKNPNDTNKYYPYNYFYKYDLKTKSTIAKFDKLLRINRLGDKSFIATFLDFHTQAYFGGNYMYLKTFELKDVGSIQATLRYDHYIQGYLIDVRDMSLVHTFVDTLIQERRIADPFDSKTWYANTFLDTLNYYRAGFSDDGSKIAMVPYNLKNTIDIFDTKTLTTKRMYVPTNIYIYDHSSNEVPILFDSTGNIIITEAEVSKNNYLERKNLIFNLNSNEYCILDISLSSNVKYKNTNYYYSTSYSKKYYFNFINSSYIPSNHSLQFNISNNKFNIINNTNNSIDLLEIYDLKSNLILRKKDNIQNVIDFNYPSGAYFIKATLNGNTETYKLIKN